MRHRSQLGCLKLGQETVLTEILRPCHPLRCQLCRQRYDDRLVQLTRSERFGSNQLTLPADEYKTDPRNPLVKNSQAGAGGH